MRPIGCCAYVYNRNLRAADKLESRTLIGHLVGCQGTNIFRIWLPTKDTVIVTRDVVFEPTLFFDGMDGYASTSVIEEVIKLLEYPEMPQDDDISIEDLLTACQRSRQTASVTLAPRAGGSQLGGEVANNILESDDALESNQQQLLSPTPSEADTIHVVPRGYCQQGEKAPQDINLDPTNTNLIVSGKRNQKPRDLNNFAIQLYTAKLGPEPLLDYLRAFSTEILLDRASASADEVP
jgi:hypothetical protein